MIGRHVSKLSGYAPALPTPFDDSGAVDRDAFATICELQLAAGATALVVCGTTGEAPTLTPSEHVELISSAIEIAQGQIPVIAGVGSNSTSHAIELTVDAEAAGADAILSVVPYYNKPTQEGLYAHFREIAGATGLPIILYDIPGRSACSLADQTLARLAELPQIIGLKDAAGDVTRPTRLRASLGREFRLLSGDDATALAFLSEGGDGCISVTSNVAPGLCRNMYFALRQGNMAYAQRLAWPIARLTKVLFKESSPSPLKCALNHFGLMSSKVRLPLVEVSEATRTELLAALTDLGEGFGDCMITKPPANGCRPAPHGHHALNLSI